MLKGSLHLKQLCPNKMVSSSQLLFVLEGEGLGGGERPPDHPVCLRNGQDSNNPLAMS